MILYIIGNGFDSHHKMDTKYSDYKLYLEQNHPDLYRDFSSCEYLINYRDKDLWNDVEKSLTLVCDDYYEDIENLYPDLTSEKTPGWDDIYLATRNEFGFLKRITGPVFRDWISSIKVKDADSKLEIDVSGYFVTFNYTYTLEQSYHIDPKRVFHIHGTIDEKMLFGSPDNDSASIYNGMKKQYSADEWFDLVYEPALKELVNCCDAASKNIKKNEVFLKSFIERIIANDVINEVVIMGNVFDGVDKPYYQDVLIPMLADATWTFYIYGEDDTKLKEEETKVTTFAEDNRISYRIQMWP